MDKKNVRPFARRRNSSRNESVPNARQSADTLIPDDATVPVNAFLLPPLFGRIRTTRAPRTKIKPFYLRALRALSLRRVARATTRWTCHQLQGLTNVTRTNILSEFRHVSSYNRPRAARSRRNAFSFVTSSQNEVSKTELNVTRRHPGLSLLSQHSRAKSVF